ncbi:MAG: hypothetical protein HZB68_00685 [Candidatus Aenigmarchaeota archaeon]|nr:hypothetical protein [Candidatus Aenigmarchaeota archaeon]
MQPKDYSKLEKELVEEYIRHLVSVSCNLEEKLEKAGVDTLGLYEFSQDLKWELLGHFNANKKNVFGKIADRVFGKKRENDIEILKDKVNAHFGGKMRISGEKVCEAAYFDDDDVIEVSVPYLCKIATGSGRGVVFHELRHSKQKAVYSSLFIEGDAEYAAIEALSIPSESVSQLLENYVSAEATLSNYIDDENTVEWKNKYLFSPAVIYFLKTNGYGNGEIEKIFNDAGCNSPRPFWHGAADKGPLLAKISSIRLSSAS